MVNNDCKYMLNNNLKGYNQRVTTLWPSYILGASIFPTFRFLLNHSTTLEIWTNKTECCSDIETTDKYETTKQQ